MFPGDFFLHSLWPSWTSTHITVKLHDFKACEICWCQGNILFLWLHVGLYSSLHTVLWMWNHNVCSQRSKTEIQHSMVGGLTKADLSFTHCSDRLTGFVALSQVEFSNFKCLWKLKWWYLCNFFGQEAEKYTMPPVVDGVTTTEGEFTGTDICGFSWVKEQNCIWGNELQTQGWWSHLHHGNKHM